MIRGGIEGSRDASATRPRERGFSTDAISVNCHSSSESSNAETGMSCRSGAPRSRCAAVPKERLHSELRRRDCHMGACNGPTKGALRDHEIDYGFDKPREIDEPGERRRPKEVV